MDEGITKAENGSFHFKKQSDCFEGDVSLYRIEDDLDDFTTLLGLPTPLNHTNESTGDVVLTTEQILQVESIYADDITLYVSITEAGQAHTTTPAVESVVVPTSLTPAQFEFALTAQEVADIDIFISAIPDADLQRQARIWRDKATTFDRNNPLLLAMATQMTAAEGLSDFTDARLDEIWVTGYASAI